MRIENARKRLAFIKSLYNVGVEQSRRAEPYCWASLLTFHDAVELFLALASEHLDLAKRLAKIEFMEYWPLLSRKLADGQRGELTQMIAIERLNKARVDLKHYGNPPSKFAIDDFRASVMNFFEENTSKVFEVEFSGISLIELVECQTTKTSLKEAENLKDRKVEDSLDKVALAFAQLIDDYESRKEDDIGRSPFFFGKSVNFMSAFFMGIEGQLGEFVDAVKESVESLQKAVKILSLGLDYRRYARFRLLTPVVRRAMSGEYVIQRVQHGSQGTPTEEDVQFCLDFVVESAIILQEFDFEVARRRQRSLSDLK